MQNWQRMFYEIVISVVETQNKQRLAAADRLILGKSRNCIMLTDVCEKFAKGFRADGIKEVVVVLADAMQAQYCQLSMLVPPEPVMDPDGEEKVEQLRQHY